MLSWQGSGGFSIDASVRIEGEDRAGVERLLRYCARPPFARPPPPVSRGPGSECQTPCCGHYIGRPEAETSGAQIPSPSPQRSIDPEPARPTNPARIRWALLLARIYEVLPLLCPACGGPMRILSFLTDPPVVVAILEHLELPHAPPPISPARGPPRQTSWIRLRPSIPPRPSRSQNSASTSRCPTSSTTEGPPPAVCPDKLSHSATSVLPSEHPPVPLHLPSVSHPLRREGDPPRPAPLSPCPIAQHDLPRFPTRKRGRNPYP